MITMDITLDSGLLQQLAQRLPAMFGQKVAPGTSAAFGTATRLVQGTWRGWALGGPLKGIPNIKNPSTRLAGSIKVRVIGPFDVMVESSSTYAEQIQNGRPELDMKTTHPFGPKSRVSQEGFPYLIVPFRWGTPNKEGGKRAHFGNFIPALLYESEISKLEKSKRTGYLDEKTNEVVGHVHTEPNYQGKEVIRSEYNWAENGRYEGDGNMDGMVRIGNDNGRGSTYFTFRVISVKQMVTKPYSWVRKAEDPIDVVGAVENTTRPLVEDILQAGLEADFGI